MNNADPRSGVTAQIASPAYSFPSTLSLEAVAEDIEENTSGAPFPNASKVTPANDSDIPNLTVIYSRAGDKQASAVEPKLYMKMNVKKIPIGQKT